MEKSLDKITWEDAIIRVVKECGGSATLKELYQNVPQIREVIPHLDANHIIRAYLRRMTRVSGKLKRIGLGIYALPDIKLEQTLFDEIQEGKTKTEIFKGIGDTDLHSYVEGMLLELGNVYGYLTYTADPSGKFGTKPLGKLATIGGFPNFKSSFYVVSQERKDQRFQKKLATDPYTEIGDRFFFRSFGDIFSLYEIAI